MATVNVTRRDAVKIAQAGHEAARSGKRPDVCPFSVTGTPAERIKAAAWLRGYAAGNR